MKTIQLFVEGKPAPQGSKRAFKTKYGKIAMIESSKGLPNWRNLVAMQAQAERIRQGYNIVPKGKAVAVSLEFHFLRPQSHYRTGKYAAVLKDSAPVYHTQVPDIDKLERAVYDALTGIIYFDDSQIVRNNNDKLWVAILGSRQGVKITIEYW